MDFEDWLREQLEAIPAKSVGQAHRQLSRLWPSPGIMGAPLVTAIGVLLAGALVALGTQLGVRDQRLASVTLAPALPVTTWAGTPPPPPLTASSGDKPDDHVQPAAPSAPIAALAPATAAASPSPLTQGRAAAPAPTAQPRPPSGGAQTFNLVGGTATISCSSGSPSLVTATPAPGFQRETELEEGGTVLSVRFRSSTHESRLDASCAAGSVQARVEESPS